MAIAFPFDFRMRSPSGDVGRAVASIWYARGTIPYQREKVAPTGSTVAVVVLGDPIIETPGGPRAEPFTATQGFLIGPHDRPVVNEPTGETFAVGIVTTPTGAPALGLEPSALAGRVLDLMTAWTPARGLRADLLALEGDPDTMLDTVEACLRGELRPDTPGLARAEAAVGALAADPARAIAEIAAELGVSHGHLDREFTRIVGLSPRRLARLLRMEQLLARLDIDEPTPWADLAAALGWVDQSHLIRDFRRHTGTTPSAYLAARRAFASEAPSAEAARFVPESM
ncbi:MAG: helix-turn-helix domain-containing protein [Chloroflexota bacterium]